MSKDKVPKKKVKKFIKQELRSKRIYPTKEEYRTMKRFAIAITFFSIGFVLAQVLMHVIIAK